MTCVARNPEFSPEIAAAAALSEPIARHRMHLIERLHFGGGRPSPDARQQIELRVTLGAASIGLDGISPINDGVTLDEKNIGALMTMISKMNARYPIPAFQGIDPTQV